MGRTSASQTRKAAEGFRLSRDRNRPDPSRDGPLADETLDDMLKRGCDVPATVTNKMRQEQSRPRASARRRVRFFLIPKNHGVNDMAAMKKKKAKKVAKPKKAKRAAPKKSKKGAAKKSAKKPAKKAKRPARKKKAVARKAKPAAAPAPAPSETMPVVPGL